MSGSAVPAPAYICCGHRLKNVTVGTGRTGMSFTYCSGCDEMRWFRNHRPVDMSGAAPEEPMTAGRRAAP